MSYILICKVRTLKRNSCIHNIPYSLTGPDLGRPDREAQPFFGDLFYAKRLNKLLCLKEKKHKLWMLQLFHPLSLIG